MSKHMGHGGYVQVGANRVDVFNWSFTKKRDKTDVTDSGSGGWRARVATVRDSSGQFELAWDDTVTPESKGFDIGNGATLKMFLGDSGLAYTVNVIFGECQFKNDNQNGVVMLVVPWEGNGAVTGPA